MKSIVILISGKQGSGKSTLARELERKLEEQDIRNRQITFAAPLYEMQGAVLRVCESYGLSVRSKYGALLQFLGTEFGRKEFGENVWVDMAKAKIDEYQRLGLGHGTANAYIISDCRFQNEFRAFPDAIRVRLDCPMEVRKARILSAAGQNWREDQNHPSEIDLDYVDNWHVRMDTDQYDVNTISDIVLHEVLAWEAKTNG